jgi:branched-chain amino acid transport system permease protein
MKYLVNAKAAILLFALLAMLPLVALAIDGSYYIALFSRVMVFALAALSLNLVVGFGGMISLGHAAFLGIGAYTVGLLVNYGVTNGVVHFAAVLVFGALGALLIGAVCLRTNAMSFIMLTLASAQLLFFITTGLKQFGGDDGFSFRGRSQFGLFSLDNDVTLYYFILGWLMLSVFVVGRIVHSRFGLALRGIKNNEARILAVGMHAYRYKLTAFVISGALCAVAGGLLANLAQFVSPSYIHWSRSAEMLVMVLIGGLGSVLGPLLGAVVFICLEEVLSHFTQHWQAPMGIILVLIVMFAGRGTGWFSAAWRRLRPAANPATRANLPKGVS